MKNIRIGNDISVRWSLYAKETGEPLYMDSGCVTLYLKNQFGSEKIEDFSVSGNVITWTFLGKNQKHCGVYSLILKVNDGTEGMLTHDACNFVNLVSCSCRASSGEDECGVETETVEIESRIEVGASGGGAVSITIDSALSKESMNPVGNRIITEALEEKQPKGDYLTEVPEDVIELINEKADKTLLSDFLKTEPQLLTAEQKATVRNNLGIDDYVSALVEDSVNDAIRGEY